MAKVWLRRSDTVCSRKWLKNPVRFREVKATGKLSCDQPLSAHLYGIGTHQHAIEPHARITLWIDAAVPGSPSSNDNCSMTARTWEHPLCRNTRSRLLYGLREKKLWRVFCFESFSRLATWTSKEYRSAASRISSPSLSDLPCNVTIHRHHYIYLHPPAGEISSLSTHVQSVSNTWNTLNSSYSTNKLYSICKYGIRLLSPLHFSYR